jgi:hypothetical protein
VVSLYDIDDVEAFVKAMIARSRVRLTPDEREELVAEGIVILFEMGRKFIPKMEGYEQEGRFSGYAARFLPRKLQDAYHAMHPEYVLRTQPDGSRKWQYNDAPWSFDEEWNDDAEPGTRFIGEFVSA